MRTVTVSLNQRQQLQWGPVINRLVMDTLGVDEKQAGSLMVEVFGRLTPTQLLSQYAVLKLVSEEVDSFRRDPQAYDRMTRSTRYNVIALGPNPPRTLGSLPSDMAAVVFEDIAVPLDVREWYDFARTIDGYRVAEQLGLDLFNLYQDMHRRYRKQGEWKGSYIDQRLVLFGEAANYRAGGVISGMDPLNDADFRRSTEDLLAAVREGSGPWIEEGRRREAGGGRHEDGKDRQSHGTAGELETDEHWLMRRPRK